VAQHAGGNDRRAARLTQPLVLPTLVEVVDGLKQAGWSAHTSCEGLPVYCSPAIELTPGSRLSLLPSGMYSYNLIRMRTARVPQRPPVVGQEGHAGPAFYTIPQAAALLCVSRMTLWRWIAAGH